ncbi:MAG: tetraacyldisaccharide 4'-kinase [Acidobacteriaceae bacterium]
MTTRRRWAIPLAPLYRGALRCKDALRSAGWLQTQRLAWPVISVGSLSVGGAGKTPVVIVLARMLREAGWTVDVLSRGYGRRGRGVERVRPGADDAARRFGDEPVLIAAQAGVAVWVGTDRYAAGRHAEAEAGKVQRCVHLLDDGFQHRRLTRDVDIVLLTREDLEDELLPVGNLREAVGSLERADVVVVRQDEFAVEVEGEDRAAAKGKAQQRLWRAAQAGQSLRRATVGGRAWEILREHGQMWTVQRRLRFPSPLKVFGAGLRPVAFCAIARPEGFAAMLQEAGCGIVETVAFPDHHAYSEADVRRVMEVARRLNGSGFVTTEKDAVKLTEAMREALEQVGPLMVVALDAEFADGRAVLRALEEKLFRVESAGQARGKSGGEERVR